MPRNCAVTRLPTDLLVPLVQSEFLTIAAALTRKIERGAVEPDGSVILGPGDVP